MARMFVWWSIGAAVTVAGYAASVMLAGGEKPRDPNDEPLRCTAQLDDRDRRLAPLNTELEQAKKRKEKFEAALPDAEHPLYVQARVAIEREEAQIERVLSQKRGLEVTPPGTKDAWQPLLIVFGLIGTLGMAWGVRKYDPWVRATKPPLDEVTPSYFLVATFFASIHLITEVGTSVLSIEKSWFGWDSFCISAASWSAMRFALTGSALTMAFPVARFYELTDSRRIPEVDLNDPTGRCGVGPYVRFIEIWTGIGLITNAVPLTIWLHVVTRQVARVDPLYLVNTLMWGIVVAHLVGRMIVNALILRRRYFEARRKLGATWSEVKSHEVPDDPTSGFLGNRWWQLPAIVSGVILATWGVLTALGVLDAIARSLS